MSVEVDHRGPVTIVSIDRPEARNAVDAAHAAALTDAFRAFESDENAFVAVLHGRGGHFCAGADLKAVAAGEVEVAAPGEGQAGTAASLIHTHLSRRIVMDNVSLTALAREHLETAQASSSGRSAETVYGGQQHTLRQTLIAIAAGQRLDEHENPGEATVHVLHGRVRLAAGDSSWSGAAGHLMVVPDSRHSLEAEEDSVVLLTTAMPRPGADRPRG